MAVFLFGLGHFQLFGFARFLYSVEDKRSTICNGTRKRVPAIRESEKRSDKMTLFDYYDRRIPDYYDWMYLDGYTPEEIMYSVSRKICRESQERENAEIDQSDTTKVKIKREVKVRK